MKKNNMVDTAKKGQTTTKNTETNQKNVTVEQLENRTKNKARRKERAEMKKRTEELLRQKKITERTARDLNAIEAIRKKKNNSPVRNTITLADKEARKKAREEQYKAFRMGALLRRCKRMKLSKEDTDKYVKELEKQLKESDSYSILIMYNKNDALIVKEAIRNEGLNYNLWTDSYLYIDGDREVLGTLRGIMPPSAKIYPRVKKKPAILPIEKNGKKASGYITKNNDKSTTAKYRRLARKAEKLRTKYADIIAHNNHKLHAELQKTRRMNNKRKLKKALKNLHNKLIQASKKYSNTVTQTTTKKSSTILKTGSTSTKQIKKAALKGGES